MIVGFRFRGFVDRWRLQRRVCGKRFCVFKIGIDIGLLTLLADPLYQQAYTPVGCTIYHNTQFFPSFGMGTYDSQRLLRSASTTWPTYGQAQKVQNALFSPTSRLCGKEPTSCLVL